MYEIENNIYTNILRYKTIFTLVHMKHKIAKFKLLLHLYLQTQNIFVRKEKDILKREHEYKVRLIQLFCTLQHLLSMHILAINNIFINY